MNLLLLKLGGSLITDKTRPHTPRLDKLEELAAEIKTAREMQPDMSLIIGHGSGSFGHVEASKYQTRSGVQDFQGWRGFTHVWHAASALNHLVMDALHQADLQVMAFPPSANVTACDGHLENWSLTPIQSALQAGIIPVVFGDVVFDAIRGGTILSTEDLFIHLARTFQPRRILLAGLETGVWEDFPVRSQLIPEITPQDIDKYVESLRGSASPDVTGGMESKVRQMLSLVQEIPGFDVLIFSGETRGNVQKALLGDVLGTRLCN